MRTNRKFVACALLAGIVVASGPQAASAGTCTAASAQGKWHFYAMEIATSNGANAISCTMTMGSDGKFTKAPCTSYQLGSDQTDTPKISGKLKVAANCNFTGTISIPGDSTVTIQAGHLNDNVGAGVATQKTGADTRVLNFTLIAD